MDIDRYFRLRNAIQEALKVTPADKGSAWRGLVATYEDIRAQAHGLVDDVDRPEFEGLFPETIDVAGANGQVTNPTTIFAQQDIASEARTRLGAMSGWLNGFIEAAQFNR